VTEIVDMGDLTPIPNSPPHICGVMDLRGNTTSIVDPKVGLGIDGDLGERIITFDSALFEDDRSVGWVVDSVKEVVDIDPENVDDAPIDRDHVRGLVKRDDEFIVWVDPQALEESITDGDAATASTAAGD
jgi:purine-binding chemotaxis protein CheW